jgi:Zn-dependent protease
MDSETILTGLFWFLAFLFSTTVHEAMHALFALKGGDPTAYQGGQVSLSPMPHIRREPIGMLVVPLVTAFSQGWAMGWASAPFDPRWADRHPRRAALMAAAGPLGNFLLAALAWTALRIGLAADYFEPAESPSISRVVEQVEGGANSVAAFLARALSILLMLNVLLGTFNLLPLPPLDGASAISLVLPDSVADRFRSFLLNPQFSLVGLVAAWLLFPYLARPLTRAVLSTLYPIY